MKKETLHLQILSYLKDQKEIVNLKKVFEKFLGEKQGLLIQNDVSECRGEDCFKRMSAILFAINRLQEDRQIVLAHIDKEVAKDYSDFGHTAMDINHAYSLSVIESKLTGYYHKLLKEHILSTIYVAEEADDYIKRGGCSKELQQAKIQTCLAWGAVIIAILTLMTSILTFILVK